MSNSDAIIGLVLDRSGSMSVMWDEAVSGFNTFKNEQAAEDGTAWMTLVAFDSEVLVRYDAWDTKDIPDLTNNDKSIFPRNLTALYDAIDTTITQVQGWLDSNEWFEGTPFLVIITDGLENASQRISGPSLRTKIQEKEAAGWKVLYLAANVDLNKTRIDLGLTTASAMSYTSDTVVSAYSTASHSVTRVRSGDTGDLLREHERSA